MCFSLVYGVLFLITWLFVRARSGKSKSKGKERAIEPLPLSKFVDEEDDDDVFEPVPLPPKRVAKRSRATRHRVPRLCNFPNITHKLLFF